MSPKESRVSSWSFLNPIDIRKGEGAKTLLMFLYFFLTIAVLYILKPVRSSLFLEELGSGNLRYVYLGEGLFLLFVTWAYIQLAKLLPRKIFFIGVLFVFISNLLVFWWLFHARVPYLSAFFYVWVACFSITSVTQFWTLANDLFDPLEAKRLFGFIISGGSAGGVLGGLITHQAVRWVRTEDLLLLSSLLLLSCVFLVDLLWKHLPASSVGSGSNRGRAPIESGSTRKLFLTMPYLWMLAGIVLLAKVASTVVDNQFNAVVELQLLGKEAKTAFFGAFSAGLNVISFLTQLCATSLSLRYLGIGISLTLLPAGLTLSSLITFLYPLLATGTLLKVFDGGMNYSIQQASKEVLYLPLPSGVRYRVKPVIDMLVYRASKSLGGLLIILFAPLFSIPNERIGILVLALIPGWIFLVWKMRSAYLALLRHHLKKKPPGQVSKSLRATEVLSFLYDEKSFGQLRSFLTQESTMARKLAAAACLVYHREGKDLEAARRLVSELIRREALEAIPEKRPHEKNSLEEKEFLDELLLREAEKAMSSGGSLTSAIPETSETILGHLYALLQNPKQGMALKRKVADYLERQATQEAADRVLGILSACEELALRFLLIRTLLRMRDRNSSIRWDRSLIKKEILREAELYQRIRQLSYFYRRTAGRKEEFLETAIGAISDESLERLFRCLGLLYPGEGIRIIYDRLVEHQVHDPVHAHAIELLQNLLGPEFSGTVEKLFDERALQEISEEKAVPLLEEMIVAPDRWLSLIAHFLVTDLGLERRWAQLDSLVSNRTFESLDV